MKTSLATRFAPVVLGTALLSGVFLIAPAAHADYYPGTNPYPYQNYQTGYPTSNYQTGYPMYGYGYNTGYNGYNPYQTVSQGFVNPPSVCTSRFDPNCILKEWGQYPGYGIPTYNQYGYNNYNYSSSYQYQYNYGSNGYGYNQPGGYYQPQQYSYNTQSPYYNYSH